MERTADRCTVHFRYDFHQFTPSDARSRPPSLILFSLGVCDLSMKAGMFLIVIALAIGLRAAVAGLSSAEYRAGIREATERYRGDCTEIVHLIVCEEASSSDPTLISDTPAVCLRDCNPFPLESFVLGSVSLSPATPNQAMELTATRLTFTLSDD
jgi:hypothetical protein